MPTYNSPIISKLGEEGDILFADGSTKKIEESINENNSTTLKEKLDIGQVIEKNIVATDVLEEATYYGTLPDGLATNYSMYFTNSDLFSQLQLQWIKSYVDNHGISDKLYTKVNIIKSVVVNTSKTAVYDKQFWIDAVNATAPDIDTMLATTYNNTNVVRVQNANVDMIFKVTDTLKFFICYISTDSLDNVPEIVYTDNTLYRFQAGLIVGSFYSFLETNGVIYEMTSVFPFNVKTSFVRIPGIYTTGIDIAEGKVYNDKLEYIGYFKKDNVLLEVGAGFSVTTYTEDVENQSGRLYIDEDYYLNNLTGKSTSLSYEKISSYINLPEYYLPYTSNDRRKLFDIVVTSSTISQPTTSLSDSDAKLVVKYDSEEVEIIDHIVIDYGKIANLPTLTTNVKWRSLRGKTHIEPPAIDYQKNEYSPLTLSVPKYNYGSIDVQDAHSVTVAGMFATASGDPAVPLINTWMLYHQGNTNTYIERIIREHNLCLIFAPLTNGGYTLSQVPKMDNFLGVAAHSDNGDNNRFDYFPTGEIFFEQVVLVSADIDGNTDSWTSSYGNGVEFFELVNNQSEATAIVAGKLAQIKNYTGASWELIRKLARSTASNAGVWDMYKGYGVIDVSATIEAIIVYDEGTDSTSWSSDYVAYKAELARQTEEKFGMPYDLALEDLSEATPITKKIAEERFLKLVQSDPTSVLSEYDTIPMDLYEFRNLYYLPLGKEGNDGSIDFLNSVDGTTQASIRNTGGSLQIKHDTDIEISSDSSGNIITTSYYETADIDVGFAVVGSSGLVGVGDATSNILAPGNPNVKVYLKGTTIADKYSVLAMNTAPASATDTGTLGEIRFTASGIFLCTATNTWIKFTPDGTFT